jgi:DUF1365 family protein
VNGLSLCTGYVTHVRTYQTQHAFRYPLYMLLVDLDELPSVNDRLRLLGYNRRRPMGLFDADHLEGQPLAQAVRATVEQAGVAWPGGRVLLLTHARILGYVFNPISLFYCFDRSGLLATVVAEVNNTYGDRHAYVLPASAVTRVGGQVHEWEAAKAMHVSPYFTMEGSYRFGITAPDTRVLVDIDLEANGMRRLASRLRLDVRPLDDWALARALCRYPLMTAQVVGAIHWEAARLWWKGLTFLPRPPHAPSRQSARSAADVDPVSHH